MTKQEFMALSLPYGLKVKEVDLDVTFNYSAKTYILMSMLDWDNSYQPILHPLSDLTKEIEHNGEVFVPMEKLGSRFSVGSSRRSDRHKHNQWV